ncbi:lysosome-associated membrane glycoprotein 1-like [Patiria miniata]|uniref:Lysosome-associated membrane glycoprotein 5 n=1 Tax=Patiria miniata TaxID=46514 RepID=A0A913ZHX5_PATMI|nr:lysosome-associated membrane glycoprotein 1-like [Patiria miniata]
MAKLLLCVLLLACSPCFRPGMSATTDAPTDATSEASTAQTTGQVSTKAGGTTVKSTATSGSTAFITTPATDEMTNATMEQTTMTTEITTDNTTTDNTTNEPTTMAITTPPVTTLPPPGKYVVNGSDGTCILMQFYLQVMITYKKTDGEVATTSVVFPDTSVPTGNCTDNSRYFSLAYPAHDDWHLRLDFNVEEKMYEMTSLTLQWKYEEPFFSDTDQMGDTDDIKFDDPKSLNVRADTGMTFECKIRKLQAESVNITLEEIKFQPYAQQSDDKGDFGKSELCDEDKPTKKPQGPADDTGMIVGIVLGSVAGVILIIGGLYFFMRHRRQRESYKSLD